MVRSFKQGAVVMTIVILFLWVLKAVTEWQAYVVLTSFDYRFGPAESLPPAVVFPVPRTKSIGESDLDLLYCKKWAYKCHSV